MNLLARRGRVLNRNPMPEPLIQIRNPSPTANGRCHLSSFSRTTRYSPLNGKSLCARYAYLCHVHVRISVITEQIDTETLSIIPFPSFLLIILINSAALRYSIMLCVRTRARNMRKEENTVQCVAKRRKIACMRPFIHSFNHPPSTTNIIKERLQGEYELGGSRLNK